MKFQKSEQAALLAWMKSQKLTLVAVGKIMKVTHVSVMKWTNGGGIHSAQLARLRPLIEPYMKFDSETQPDQELISLRAKLQHHAETHADLVRLYSTVLDQIEEFIARQPQLVAREGRSFTQFDLGLAAPGEAQLVGGDLNDSP